MDDIAHVRFVDPHAEGDRRHDDLHIVAQESLLYPLPLAIRQAGVVGGSLEPGADEFGGDLLHPLTGEGVDDAGLLAAILDKGEELHRRFDFVDDRVTNIRPIEAGDEDGGVLQAEAGKDIGAGLRVGGGGQGNEGDAGEVAAQTTELDIFRAEIVPPLRNAVRFVDGEEGNGDLGEAGKELFAHQPFRGDIKEVKLAAMELCQGLARFGGFEGRVVNGGADAVGLQGIDLILHQRDQRRDDDADAGPVQRRDLEAEGFAAAGRHEDKSILAGDQAVDDFFLIGAKGAVAEDALQGFTGSWQQGWISRRGRVDGVPAAGRGWQECLGMSTEKDVYVFSPDLR